MKHYFLILLLLIGIFSCKKDENTNPENAPASCESFTMTINDTLTAILTSVHNNDVCLLKIKNGITDTVAFETGYEFWGPSISPDKKKFVCFKSVTGNSEIYNDYTVAELWMFNIDGTHAKLITTLGMQGWHAMGMAQWAPDANHIVLSAEKMETDGNYHWNIYLTDTNGVTGIKMNTRLGYFAHPHFANGDMTKITYSAWPVGITSSTNYFSEIHTATVDGSYHITSENRLTSNLDYETNPNFSSDNNTICFAQTTSNANNTPINIVLYNLVSSTSNTVISNGQINQQPIWSLANNMIYFVAKTGSYCLNQINYCTSTGGSNMVTYRKMNIHFVQIAIR